MDEFLLGHGVDKSPSSYVSHCVCIAESSCIYHHGVEYYLCHSKYENININKKRNKKKKRKKKQTNKAK